MPPRFADGVKHWPDRAAAMRSLAAELKEPDVIALMFARRRLRQARRPC